MGVAFAVICIDKEGHLLVPVRGAEPEARETPPAQFLEMHYARLLGTNKHGWHWRLLLGFSVLVPISSSISPKEVPLIWLTCMIKGCPQELLSNVMLLLS
jgi:hypothetical protein